MKYLIIALALIVLLASGAVAQTAPAWVSNNQGTGFIPCYQTAPDDGSNRSLGFIEVSAGSSGVSFTAWAYEKENWPSTTWNWRKIRPLRWVGSASTDSVITVGANMTKSFRFSPKATALYVSAGDAVFQGE